MNYRKLLLSTAKSFSIILHPLLMPLYGTLLFFYYNHYLGYLINPSVKYLVIGVVFLFTFLLPSVAAYWLKIRGQIHSLEMDDPRDRRVPFAITAFFYMSAYYALLNLRLPQLFNLLLLGSTLMIFVALIINFKWKVSIHMIGIGGIAGGMVGISQRLFIDMLWPTVFVIILAGILGTSRLILKAHYPSQVYIGFLLGFAGMFLLFSF